MYQEPKKGRGKQIAFYLHLTKKPYILRLQDKNSHELYLNPPATTHRISWSNAYSSSRETQNIRAC